MRRNLVKESIISWILFGANAHIQVMMQISDTYWYLRMENRTTSSNFMICYVFLQHQRLKQSLIVLLLQTITNITETTTVIITNVYFFFTLLKIMLVLSKLPTF